MRAKGSEIMSFYKDWPIGDDFYHDDGYEVNDDGELVLHPDEEYDVEEAIGYLAWQGSGPKPSHIVVNGSKVPIPHDWEGPSSLDVFRAWRGDKKPYSVMLGPEDAAKFKTLCAENGWEVSG